MSIFWVTFIHIYFASVSSPAKNKPHNILKERKTNDRANNWNR